MATAVESDIRYYRRRACEELAAAERAITEAARDRRLQLVDVYLAHLKELDVPSPFDDDDSERLAAMLSGRRKERPAFAWRGAASSH